MNKYQMAAIRTYGKGAYRDIASLDGEDAVVEAIKATEDFVFQDVIDALENVTSNEEALARLRQTISNDNEIIAAPAMAR